ncbi:MAG: hypothetical protein AB8F26_12590 [Phycisphaerales bacterium]
MEDIFRDLIHNEDVFLPMIIAGAILTALFFKGVTKVITNGARERTKREIAAYIAEGSMTPEHGERILKAGDRRPHV